MRSLRLSSQRETRYGGGWRRRRSVLLLSALLFILSESSPSHAFEFRGFGDVTFTKNDAAGSQNSHGSFTLGQFDLYLTQAITDRIDVLAELSIETESEQSSQTGIDLERLQISYQAKDWLVIRAGRFHNLLGYWNLTFHHGRQLQTTIDRPSMLFFEDKGGFLPIHLVGLWLGGYVPAGPLLINYGIMAGNGPKITGLDPILLNGGSLDPNNAVDNSGNKAVSFNLTFHPLAVHNLGFSVCGNFSQIEGFDTAGLQVANINQQILCGELHYVTEAVELLAEYYLLLDTDKLTGLGHFVDQSGYVQLAYTFADKYIPYVRYERTAVDEGDPYMAMLEIIDTSRTILGFRYNLSSASSLKAEVRFVNPGVQGKPGNAHVFAVQWAFWF